MNPETQPSSAPLFGNNPSDLMRAAIDPATHARSGDLHAWQPPSQMVPRSVERLPPFVRQRSFIQ